MVQVNLASKTDIADVTDFVKTTGFGNKLISFNKSITSSKTRDIEVKTKLDNLEKKFKQNHKKY